MKRIILSLALLMLSVTDQRADLPSYETYKLDTTANLGTGFGNATPSFATGYTTSSFLTSSILSGNASAIQPDGKIVVVGSKAGVTPEKAVITRYNINGTLDTTFNGVGYQTQIGTTSTFSTNNNVVLTDVCVQPNGGIVVVGYATPTGGGDQSIVISRLTPGGVADTTFNTVGYLTLNLGVYLTANASGNPTTTSTDTANAVALDASGNIIVAGSTVIYQNVLEGASSTTSDVFVVQYNSSGVLQTSFNSGAVVSGSNDEVVVTAAGIGLISMSTSTDVTGNGMAIDAAGKIVVVGSYVSGSTSMFIARFLNTGVLDTSNFNSSGTPGYLSVSISSPTIGYDVGFQSESHGYRIIVSGGTNGAAVAVGITNAGVVDTTFGQSASGYYANGWGGSTPVAYGVEIQSDDTIVIAGTNNNSGASASFILNIASADGASSISFNTTSISEPSFGGSISLQQNGSIVQVGTVGTANTPIGIARYLGVPVEGAMNLYYNPSGSNPGYAVYPTTSTPTDQPQVTAMYPLSDGGAYVVTHNPGVSDIITGNACGQVNVLDANGISGTAGFISFGSSVSYNYGRVNDVIADAQDNAIIVGLFRDNGGHGWIARYINIAGVMTLDTTFGLNGGFTVDSRATNFVRVGKDSNGNYLAVGQGNAPHPEHGVAILYYPTGASVPGRILILNAIFCDVIIDADDYIYIVYQNNAGSGVGFGNICIAKYQYSTIISNFVIDTTFGDTGILDTGLDANLYGAPCLTFDNSGNVVVGAVNLDNDDITFQSYSPSTGDVFVSASAISRATSLLVSPVMTKLQCDTDGELGRLICTGYDNNNFFVGRMISQGGGEEEFIYALDTSFAPYSTCPGILKTNYNDKNPTNATSLTVPYRFSNTVCITTLGSILFGGYENITSTSTISVIGQVIDYIDESEVPTQVDRFATGSVAQDGTLATDTPFDLNTSASLSGQPQALYTFGSGIFNGYTLVVTTNGTTATLSMLDATTYTLNNSSGATSFGDGETAGSVTLSALVNAVSMLVDVAGNIYVLGADNTDAVVIVKVSSNGLYQTSFYPVDNSDVAVLTQAYGIVQQASGRILICGYNSSIHSGPGSGLICAINPNDGSLDTSFAPNSMVPGCFIPGEFVGQPTPPVMSIAVGETNNAYDDADKIYCVFGYSASSIGYAGVARILENGTQFDPSFSTGDTYDNFIHNVTDPIQMRLQINVAGEGDAYVTVVANTTTGIQAARYDRSNGDLDTAAFVVIPSSVTPAPTLQEVLCLSDGTTLILSSYGDTAGTLDLARLTTDFEADATFNSGGANTGVLTTTVPASSPTQAQFWAMDVLGNGGTGIIVASDDNAFAADANPYFTQVVNSTAVTKYPQTASVIPTPGIVDGTFNAAGDFPGSLNVSSELPDSADDSDITANFPASAVAQVLLQVENGWYYIAGSDGTNTYIAYMSDDDVLQDFGTHGVVTLSNHYGVSSMMLGQDGNLFFAGTGANASATTAWLASCDASNGDLIFYVVTDLNSHLAMAQQSNGRILISGVQGGVGAITACNSVTGAIDTTFADNGVYLLTTGTGEDVVDYAAINSILVDAADNIYVIANETSGIYRPYVFSLNATATIINWTSINITAYSTIAANNHLAFNQAGDIVAVAVNTLGSYIHVRSYAPADGTQVTVISGGIGAIGSPNITSLSVDLNTSPGKLILTGYNSSVPFVLRTNAAETALDTTFYSGSGTPGIVTTNSFGEYDMIAWYDAMINADGKITVAGFGTWTEDPFNNPFLVRFYGDEFIGQYEQPVVAGTPGTLNLNFPDDNPTAPTAGFLTLDVSSIGQPVAVLPLADGGQFVGFSDGVIVRYTNENILDTSFGAFNNGYAAQAPAGLTSMILDGNGCLVVVGTLAVDGGPDLGWMSRYQSNNSGQLDDTFNEGDVLYIENCQAANAVLEQSLARLIVVGQLNIPDMEGMSTVGGALFGLTNTGTPDETFSIYSDSGVGVANSNIPLPLYACVADQYDRLLIAGINSSSGSNYYVGIARLTSSAEYDLSFGTDSAFPGVIFNVLPNPVEFENISQVKIALDANNNIVVAANTTSVIEVIAYPNTTDVTDPSIQLIRMNDIPAATLTGMVTTADGKVLLCGNQPSGEPMWVARLVSSEDEMPTYILDTTFAPDSVTPGIMFFNINMDICELAPIAIYGTGEITMVGFDTSGETIVPFMSRAYNNPYVPAMPICLDSLPQGTVDQTFGVTNNDDNNGITFWAYEDESGDQSAQAVGLYDDDNVVVALQDDYGAIYLNIFNVDGLLAVGDYPHDDYQEIVLDQFDAQFVDDMVVYTTIDGVTRAILAGYAKNTTPHLTSSLLVSYDIDNVELDQSFGGFNGNIPGVAFGDARKLHTVGLQSNGRIIACGSDYSRLGVVLGYTSTGNLDQSFGQGGAFAQGDYGIHTSAIDMQDRLVIAYKNQFNNLVIARILEDGSDLDTTFSSDGILTTSIALQDGSHKNFGLVLDGSGNIIVAAVNVEAEFCNIYLAKYTSSGVLVGTVATISSMSLTDFNITQVLIDQSGAVVVVGNDNSGGENDQVVVARFVYDTTAYILDSSFNDGDGFIKYQVQHGDTQLTNRALIHPDGRIIITGSQSGVV